MVEKQHESQHELPKARVRVKHPYLAMMGLYLGGFTGMYSETALNIALPSISAQLGVDISLTQWLVVGYMLVIGLIMPFASLLSKWFSARAITSFALCAFMVGSMISGVAPNFALVLAGRALQGVGTGLVLPLMFSMILEVIPPHKIGAAMGFNALIIMGASAIGPTLAGFLIGAFSWRIVFASFAAVLVVALVIELKFGVSPYKITKPSVDSVSIATSCFGFGGIVFAAGVASMFGWASAPVLAGLAIGVVCLVVYVRRQASMESPVIDMRIFRQRAYAVGTLCVTLNFGITLAAMFILPQFYQNAMGLSASTAGALMLPAGIVNMAVSAVAGSLFDKVGARIPALVGFALSVCALIGLISVSAQASVMLVMACHILLMIGVPLAMSPAQTYALSSLSPQLSTDGSAMLNTLQQVFGAIATALATFLLAYGQAFVGEGGAAAFTTGSHFGFALALTFAVLALIVATRIKSGATAGVADGEDDAGTAAAGTTLVAGETGAANA